MQPGTIPGKPQRHATLDSGTGVESFAPRAPSPSDVVANHGSPHVSQYSQKENSRRAYTAPECNDDIHTLRSETLAAHRRLARGCSWLAANAQIVATEPDPPAARGYAGTITAGPSGSALLVLNTS